MKFTISRSNLTHIAAQYRMEFDVNSKLLPDDPDAPIDLMQVLAMVTPLEFMYFIRKADQIDISRDLAAELKRVIASHLKVRASGTGPAAEFARVAVSHCEIQSKHFEFEDLTSAAINMQYAIAYKNAQGLTGDQCEHAFEAGKHTSKFLLGMWIAAFFTKFWSK